MKKYALIVLSLITSIPVCNSQESNPGNWVEDLNFYQKTLEEKHIDLYHSINKEKFESELQKIKDRIPELTDFQIVIETMRLTRQIGDGNGDGHTSVPLWGMNLHKYPIEVMDFNGDLRVVKVIKSQKELLGKKLLRIDSIPVDQIFEQVANVTPFTENKQSSLVRTCQYMMISELLFGLNLTNYEKKANFTFEDETTAEEISVGLSAIPTSTISDLGFESILLNQTTITKPDNAKSEKLWFSTFNDNKGVYIKFGAYPSDIEMNVFSEGVYNHIEKFQSEYLIVDLRDNFGGDFFVGLILASWLNAANSIRWDSGVYVLTNRVTYSAAMVNTVQFRQILNAKIVGEPTGANPNGYQDMGQFHLPNSNLLVTYSKRLFHFQETDTKGVQPDILIVPDWNSYKNKRDIVVEWVLENIDKFE